MAIDWDKWDPKIDEAIDQAGKKTDEKLASTMSSLTRLTDEEIRELFPESADVEKLRRLLKIVKSAEDRNNKVNSIIKHIEEFGGIIVPLLEKLA